MCCLTNDSRCVLVCSDRVSFIVVVLEAAVGFDGGFDVVVAFTLFELIASDGVVVDVVVDVVVELSIVANWWATALLFTELVFAFAAELFKLVIVYWLEFQKLFFGILVEC